MRRIIVQVLFPDRDIDICLPLGIAATALIQMTAVTYDTISFRYP